MCDRLPRSASNGQSGKALAVALVLMALSGSLCAQLTDTALAVTASSAVPPLSAPVPVVPADPFSALRTPAPSATVPAPSAAPALPPVGTPPPATGPAGQATTAAAASLPVPPPVVPAPAEASGTPMLEMEEVPLYPISGEDTLQTASRLDAALVLEGYYAKLELARQARERSRQEFERETLKSKQEQEALVSGVVPGAAAKALPKPVEPLQPYVNSIYRLGDTTYAEMRLGTNQVVAKAGTLLINGESVLSIGEGSVTLKGAKGLRVLPLRGSAEMAAQ